IAQADDAPEIVPEMTLIGWAEILGALAGREQAIGADEALQPARRAIDGRPLAAQPAGIAREAVVLHQGVDALPLGVPLRRAAPMAKLPVRADVGWELAVGSLKAGEGRQQI